MRDELQKENETAASESVHESYVIQPGDTLFQISLERYGDAEKEIELYIKFKKESNDYVIVISFHEAKYPVKKYFHWF